MDGIRLSTRGESGEARRYCQFLLCASGTGRLFFLVSIFLSAFQVTESVTRHTTAVHYNSLLLLLLLPLLPLESRI
ncbi:hypothetical protein BX600DRAFT_462805 [Xylariales sp. PMI_506]|nr:hypothetical protein BX600DRAFT_462805 [Xylariales sp. PMI_506]